MNVQAEITRINTVELLSGVSASGVGSWHDDYRNSAYVFIGGLHHDLTEGDVLAVFSQFGEVVDLNLLRHKDTGLSRGCAFLAYEDQRSTVLAVDNMNAVLLCARPLTVNHHKQYRIPKGQAKATNDLAGDESEFEYLARRRAIWDYEAYAQPIEGTSIRSTSSGSSSGKERKRQHEQSSRTSSSSRISSVKEGERIAQLLAQRRTRQSSSSVRREHDSSRSRRSGRHDRRESSRRSRDHY